MNVLGDTRDELNETFTLDPQQPGQCSDRRRPRHGHDPRRRPDTSDQPEQSELDRGEHGLDQHDVFGHAVVGEQPGGDRRLRDRRRHGDGGQRLHGDHRDADVRGRATTPRTFTVPILGDTLDEPNETFTVGLSNPVNAVAGTDAGPAPSSTTTRRRSRSGTPRSRRATPARGRRDLQRDAVDPGLADGDGEVRDRGRDGDGGKRLHGDERDADVPAGHDDAARGRERSG